MIELNFQVVELVAQTTHAISVYSTAIEAGHYGAEDADITFHLHEALWPQRQCSLRIQHRRPDQTSLAGNSAALAIEMMPPLERMN